MFEILLGIAMIVLASKLGPAFARRIGGGSTDTNTQRLVEELEQRVTQNEERIMELSSATHERLVEAEERLDFTERVLQQERAKGKLGT
jgi:vacuolar-type H+-ATPase subunit I/STV1